MTVEIGRKAVERREWGDAVAAFHDADHADPLSPEDLELLADAAWWAGEPDESVEVLERAHTGYIEQGSDTGAARVAVALGYLAARRQAFSIAGGWLARAHRLLEGHPESVVNAQIKVIEIIETLYVRGDVAGAIATADETVTLARRLGSRDAESQALAFKGIALIMVGQWKEGLGLLDEATAAAVSGEIGLRAASDIYCQTISACRAMADFRRAGEWTEEADRWMNRYSVTGYTGVCSVHRAELKRLHGNWPEAQEEARAACVDLERYHIIDAVGYAYHEIGEVLFRTGDLVGAEKAFLMAYENGENPQPGLALLMLARGEGAAAASSLASALAQTDKGILLARVTMLPAQVEIALTQNDIETARVAIEELESITAEFERPAFEAATLTAKGDLALHLGEAEEAAVHLERAWRLWKEVEFPYETARARVLLGQARANLGDAGSARMELGAARSTFERLGATLDLKRVDELLYESRAPDADRDRVTKTLMFTDIVVSTDLVRTLGEDRWENLLRWHDNELRSLFGRHQGVEVSHTGDGFFVTFDRPSDAVEAAVAIQRRMTEHRRESGFAPWVRIGIHQAEVTKDGGDYRGQGVHVAARVGAVAEEEEIVISAAALSVAGEIKFPLSKSRSVELKGVLEPVEVSTVDWR
ncbi:MAG TPA: adenylate/guanylate cyclase domain-containing protein [Acidimicrobiia bacterium]